MVRWLLPSVSADAPNATRRFETANHETTGETNAQEDCTHGCVRCFGCFRGGEHRESASAGDPRRAASASRILHPARQPLLNRHSASRLEGNLRTDDVSSVSTRSLRKKGDATSTSLGQQSSSSFTALWLSDTCTRRPVRNPVAI